MLGLYPEIEFHLRFTPHAPTSLKGRRLTLPLLPNIEVLYVFGVAEDFSPLTKWLAQKTSRKAVILEDNLGALAALWEIAEDLLSHPQISIRFLSKKRKIELAACVADFPNESFDVAGIAPYQRRLPALKLELKRQTVVWNSLLMESLHAPYFYRNLLSNLTQLPRSFLLNTWRDRFRGVPAIICGAGPSLEVLAPLLKQLEGRALIIAGGSALSALSHLGIRPHLGVAVDPNPQEYDAVKGCTARDIPLLYCSRVSPRVFEVFTGPLGYVRAGTGGALESYFEEKLGIEVPKIGSDLSAESLSVTTLSTAIAHTLGCDPIIFAGVDLAYTGNQHYAPGVSTPKASPPFSLKRKDCFGRPVATKIEWIMEAASLSSFARLHQDRSFYNASGGLPMKSIPHFDLQTLLHGKPRDFDFSAKLMKIPAPKPFLQELLESLKRCHALTLKLSQVSRESGHAVVLQYDLEEESAYIPLLREIIFAYKLKNSHADLWSFLTNAINIYIDAIYSSASVD